MTNITETALVVSVTAPDACREAANFLTRPCASFIVNGNFFDVYYKTPFSAVVIRKGGKYIQRIFYHRKQTPTKNFESSQSRRNSVYNKVILLATNRIEC